jgi:hypothetical protein
MIPVDHPNCNHYFHLPGAPGEGVMPCLVDTEAGTTRSYWRPEPNDNMIDGDAVFVHVMAPPNMVGTIKLGVATDSGIDLQETETTLTDQGGAAASAAFKLDTLELFMDEGYFVLEVNQCPPYPVSVWIDKVPDNVGS